VAYHDSTGRDAACLRERLAADGYLYLRNVLPPAAMERARTVVVDAIREAGWGDWDGKRAGIRCRPDIWDVLTPDRYNAVFRFLWTHRDVYSLAHEPSLLAVIQALLRAEPFVHPLKIFRIMVPTPADEPRWPARHQDFPELQGASDQLTVWIPLFPVGPASGALPIYPGTHRHGILPLSLSTHPSGWQVVLPDGSVPDISDIDPGDVLVFSTFTVHGGSVNQSENIRVSVDVRYQPMSSPICAANLDINGVDYTWEEGFSHWDDRDPLKLYWLRRRPPTVPFDPRWELWREAEAIRSGRQGDAQATRALHIVSMESESAEIRAEAAELLCRLRGHDVSGELADAS
jgi:phytanoyl-CoA dioxygenase PhyH